MTRTNVAAPVIVAFENNIQIPGRKELDAIIRTLESAGIAFVHDVKEGVGVRLVKKTATCKSILTLQAGKTSAKKLRGFIPPPEPKPGIASVGCVDIFLRAAARA